MVSPEGDLIQTKSDALVLDEHEKSEAERPTLTHSATAPGAVNTPTTEIDAALQSERENVSPTDKG